MLGLEKTLPGEGVNTVDADSWIVLGEPFREAIDMMGESVRPVDVEVAVWGGENAGDGKEGDSESEAASPND